MVPEVQEALGQEWLEFTGVRSIELIRFSDSGLNRQFPGVVETIGQLTESLCEVR